ncbi:MAG: exodeoxyribonuclease VII large subunit [Chloroflexota bacterium]|nr:exodeoxyribonuclease VII large subunit [Chloroflexota bacterium]
MPQPSLFQITAWSVTETNRYLRDLIESDHNLGDLWVQGEVSNFARPRSGHIYFTLKDERASLRCVMWRSSARRQKFIPKNGDAVEVHGKISVYKAGGQYQLYASTIKPMGQGALYQEFLRLKAKLENEGLFDDEHKRPIPRWPRRIGIVTSPTGAALRDMLNTLRRRYPLIDVIIAPSLVQGRDAPRGIVRGLRSLNEKIHPDVILLSRGGGSIEDLWAFNAENVARAIAASAAPVITGVGHQTDFTIADFVADLRAPTPTAAAELATPNRDDLHIDIAEAHGRLAQIISTKFDDQHWRLSDLTNQLQRLSPRTRIRSDRQRLDELMRRATTSLRHSLKMQRASLTAAQQRLRDLNPKTILARGYAIVSDADRHIVHSVEQVEPGDPLRVRVNDGEFDAQVQRKS